MLELEEPRPLIGPRGVIALFLGFVLLLAVGSLGVMGLQGERVLTWCSDHGPRNPTSYSTETDLKLFPPSWDCVWRNDRGEVLGRRRYEP
jgi:hypothetical protein